MLVFYMQGVGCLFVFGRWEHSKIQLLPAAWSGSAQEKLYHMMMMKLVLKYI